MSNPFEAFLFRGRSNNLTNISRQPPPIIEVIDDDDLWTSPGKQATPSASAVAPQIAQPKLSQLSDDELLLGKAKTPETLKPKPMPVVKPPPMMEKKPILISQLPWSAKLSGVRREQIVDVFQAQFCNFLLDNPVAYKTFAPFVQSKYVDRNASETVCLEGPPTIDAIHIRCQPGNALRNYQVDGVRFLLDNFHKGMSSILADDMGLGKTAQVCSFLQLLNTLYGIKGPHLIIVPLTTITNWVREMTRWAPTLTVLKYHGSKDFRNKCGFATEHRHSVVVTTPATAVNEKETLKSRAWGVVMVDEAHSLKNESTTIVNVCSRLTAAMRISITGTPFQNTLSEMWTQMGFLFPYISTKRFELDEDNVAESSEIVKNLLAYIMLRRTKTQMDLGLPPRVDEPTMMIEPSPMQRRLLDAVRKCAEGGDTYVIKRLFMALRKVCNHPMLLKLLADPSRKYIQKSPFLSIGIARLQSAGLNVSEEHLVLPSAKIIKLDHMLEQLRKEGRKVLIFSNFTSQLDILEGLCTLRGYSFDRLDGMCSRTERELSVIKFNHKKSTTFAFLVTTTAGGVGVTLTGADTVIIYDCHFNPQMDRQAADRAHRIGQTKTVYVYRMCLKGTAEEKIQEISLRKAAMGDYVLDGSVTKRSDQTVFSLEEIRKILAATDRGVLDDDETPMEKELISIVTEGVEEAEESAFDAPREVKDYTPYRTNVCFGCGEKMRPLEPLKFCDYCPKGYHPDCVPEEPKKIPRWSCHRHRCMGCDKTAVSDGALFLCASCPKSFCFDCLDPRYLSELDASGLCYRDISSSYHGMAAEGVEPVRTLYYITCMGCSGIETSETETASSVEEASKNEMDLEDDE